VESWEIMAKNTLRSVYAQWLTTAYPEVRDPERIQAGAAYLVKTSSEHDRTSTEPQAEVAQKELSHLLGCRDKAKRTGAR